MSLARRHAKLAEVGDPGELLPRYVRIAEILQERIRSDEYQAGSLLPGETTLSREFGVSRGTIRQAIALLRDRGVVAAEVGRGTRVITPQPRKTVLQILDFNEEVRRSGRVPSTRVLSRGVISASREVASRLRIKRNSKVIRIVRTRSADGSPLVHETRYIALDTCPGLLHEDVENQSIHHLLLEKYGIPLVKIDLTVKLTALPADVAGSFGVDPGSLAVCLDRVTYQSERLPVTWYHAFYLSDHFDLSIYH